MNPEGEHARWTEAEGAHGYVRARVHLLATGDGGRSTALVSGYRAHWSFPSEVHDQSHDAPLTLEAGPSMRLGPGQQATVRLHPLCPDLWPDLVPGIRLAMMEGARVIGYAEVLETIPATG